MNIVIDFNNIKEENSINLDKILFIIQQVKMNNYYQSFFFLHKSINNQYIVFIQIKSSFIFAFKINDS